MSNNIKSCLGVILFLFFFFFLPTILPELFILIWILTPLLIPFFLPVSDVQGFNYYGGVLSFNFLFYIWGLGDRVKESFGEKYIKGFQSYSYDEEYGRYDISHTTYEFYIPDIFWNNIYDWFGTFFFIYSIFCYSVVGFFYSKEIEKDRKKERKRFIEEIGK